VQGAPVPERAFDSEVRLVRVDRQRICRVGLELDGVGAGRVGSAHELLHLVEATLVVGRQLGDDAVKLQTYTADTLTIDSDQPYFRVEGTLWDGRTLHDLYREAHTPWEWHAPLFALARQLGLEIFSSPFDPSAVELLEGLGAPAYKVASFEIIDLPLVRRIARTGKPMILSTGAASQAEVDEAVAACRNEGNDQLVLLKCTSAYPAPPSEMNLRTIPALADRFGVPVGLSDHTLGVNVAVAAVALGACVIEKHFTLSRAEPGPDSAFSLEPYELRALVHGVREAHQALGTVAFGVTRAEAPGVLYRRSLFVVADVGAGEKFTSANVRSIRPGHGLSPKHLDDVLGRVASRDLARGTPLAWEHVRSLET
jgi:pseudaminic acid synthase